MLTIVSQFNASAGYDLQLSDSTWLHIHKNNPSQDEINNLLFEHERRVLDEVNIGAEEQSEYITVEEELPIGTPL